MMGMFVLFCGIAVLRVTLNGEQDGFGWMLPQKTDRNKKKQRNLARVRPK